MNHKDFMERNRQMVLSMGQDRELAQASRAWFDLSARYEYSYHFSWLGLPMIQYPQDIVALQEIVWSTQPDLVLETGIARGGSLVFYASMLQLLGGAGRVLGIDVDIRQENRKAIAAHPLSSRIEMIQGSSVDPAVAAVVHQAAKAACRVMVVLDSNHSHDHVREELRLYAPLVSVGCYLVVCDTVIEDMPAEAFPNRPWGRGNNPRTAVREFLRSDPRFAVDRELDAKLQITVSPEGYLRRIS